MKFIVTRFFSYSSNFFDEVRRDNAHVGEKSEKKAKENLFYANISYGK